MQYFPHYPFTLRALKEGLITEEKLTDEYLSKSVFENWTFIPKVFTFNRKDFLENCVYLLAYNSIVGKILSVHLRKKESYVLGFMANVLAKYKYIYMFRAPWLRRFSTGITLLLGGDFKLLASKIRRKMGY